MASRAALGLGLLLAIAGMAGCEEDPGLVVLPLGDSLTRGKYLTPSYRYYLADLFEQEGVAFDFIGRLRGAGGEGGTGRAYDLRAFPEDWDDDHEGHGGASWADVSNLSAGWFAGYHETPDLVLVLLGTNDANRFVRIDHSLASAAWMLDDLERRFPEAAIVLGLPPPLAEPEAEAHLQKIRAGLQEHAETIGLPFVDFTEAFDPALYLHEDGVHLTPRGDVHLARGWAREIARLGLE